MIVREHTSDPFAISHTRVEGRMQDVDAAISSLAYELALAAVRGPTVTELVRAAEARNASPRRPPNVVDGIILDAFLRSNKARNAEAAARRADAKRRGVDDEPPSDQERVHLALSAVIRASLHDFVYDEDTAELDATWSETGDRLRLPLGGEPRDLQKAIIRRVGDLDTFARRAHEKAKKGDVLRVLRDLALHARLREKNSEDSEPVQLVEAILGMKLWKDMAEPGQPSRRVPVHILSRPGVYATEGVALIEADDRPGAWILVVQMSSIADGLLKAAQFRNRTQNYLTGLLRRAPGFMHGKARKADSDYYSPREVRDAFGTRRTYGVRLDEFSDATGSALNIRRPSSPKTDASDASDEKSPETPVQQAFDAPWDVTP